ncbi:hypothetical protein D3C72_1911910 [compost metagenome]
MASTASKVAPKRRRSQAPPRLDASMPARVPAPCAPISKPSAGAPCRRSLASTGRATCSGPMTKKATTAQ